MKIGIPKEIKAQEHRVALVPTLAATLIRDGHEVFVEQGAGMGSGFPDDTYRDAGATIISDHEKVFEEAELIVKVKEPIASEYGLLRSDHVLFTYLHLAADLELTEALIRSRCTAIAYETVFKNGKLPLLEPMSEIAGRMAAIVGAYHLSKNSSGMGKLLGGIPGVLPAKVMVIGGGTAGVNAATIAAGLGADVTIMEVDVERMRFLDLTMPNQVKTCFSTQSNIELLLSEMDLVIGAVLVPGAKAPKLITRPMLSKMQPGAVLVDIAIDQGGCMETSRPTTHQNPTYEVDGITHYCVANMPGAYARTATLGLTNVTFGYLREMAHKGVDRAIRENPSLQPGVNVRGGEVCYRAVAEAHGLPYMPLSHG
jgi:alanine dehydrogenase